MTMMMMMMMMMTIMMKMINLLGPSSTVLDACPAKNDIEFDK